jgi:hypothetical protein
MIDYMRCDSTPTGRGADKCSVLRRAQLKSSTYQKCRLLSFKVTPAVHSRSWSVRHAFVGGSCRRDVFASHPVTGANDAGLIGPKMPKGRYDPSRTLFSLSTTSARDSWSSA